MADAAPPRPDARGRVVLEEAAKWRAEGRIDEAFHGWLRARYGTAGRPEAGQLQSVLVLLAGALTVVGIVTLASEFWHRFTDGQKYGLLVACVLLSCLLGWAAGRIRRLHVLAAFFLLLPLPIYVFALSYANFSGYAATGPANPLRATELAAIAFGALLSVGALALALRSMPTLALGAPASLVASLAWLHRMTDLGLVGARIWNAALLAMVVSLEAALILRWSGPLLWPRRVRGAALRIAMASNVPWGFALIILLVFEAARRPDFSESFDATLVSIVLTAVYAVVLLVIAVRLGVPELAGIAALLIVVDAVWLGSDRGGIVGSLIAIFATAGALLLLAQQGVLRRMLRARPPDSVAP